MDYTPVNDKYSHLTQTNKQTKKKGPIFLYILYDMMF